MSTKEPKQIIVAIDGFSSSGKSTMAKHLAKQVGYRYIDSGAMYRAVTLYAMEHGWVNAEGMIEPQQIILSLPDIEIDFMVMEDGTQHTLLNERDVESEIRSMRVSNCVSPVSAIHEVRLKLVSLQQKFGQQKGIVMDGRDIGTVVFPQAELKVFVEASAQTRAQRRLKELLEKGAQVNFEEVLANVVSRDHIDMTREDSPLRKAEDAIALDNSNMSIDEQEQWLLDAFNFALKQANQDA